MGCVASKLDIETDRPMLSGLRPIRIKKYRRRRLKRFNTFSATTELLQSEELETTGDTSTSGKVKASAVAPEPIAEEEVEDEVREELTKREVLEMKRDMKEKREEFKENTVEVSKDKLEERNQERDKLTGNMEEPKDEKEETSQRVTEEMKKKNSEEAKEEGEEKGATRSEKLEQERNEPEEKEESISIQCRTEELLENMEKRIQGRTVEMKAKEEERSQQMTTEEPKKNVKEIRTKNEELLKKNEDKQEYGPNLVSNRITEDEEVFQGSPSFRIYCRDIQSFDSEDSITLSGFNRSTERLEEIKKNNEPIEEVSESQASSKGFECNSPRKRRGRRLLKLKAPNAVRSLFTCYSAGNSCANSSSGSSRFRNRRLVGNISN